MNWRAFIVAITLVVFARVLAMILTVDPATTLAMIILFNYYYDKYDKEE